MLHNGPCLLMMLRGGGVVVTGVDSDVGALTSSVDSHGVARVVNLDFPAVARLHQIMQALKQRTHV